jgi:predicted RNA binding protein YcfA (HicA-like mRNA interferase family)
MVKGHRIARRADLPHHPALLVKLGANRPNASGVDDLQKVVVLRVLEPRDIALRVGDPLKVPVAVIGVRHAPALGVGNPNHPALEIPLDIHGPAGVFPFLTTMLQDCIFPPTYWLIMGKYEKVISLILSGSSDSNIAFDDLCRLLRRLGFDTRVRGSHHIFFRTGVVERINLQRDGSKAKPYQVRQIRRIVTQYRLGEDL